MRKLLTMLAAMLALALPLAFAQKIVISPEAIVVNPNPAPGFTVSVSLNKGGARPVYQIGENVQISVRVSQSAYVYLFSVTPSGRITQILPNRYDQQGRNNYLPAGGVRTFPPPQARYSFTVAPPRGLSKVIAVASKQRLDTSQIAQFKAGQNFASSDIGQNGFVHEFAIIVKPLPQRDWVTGTALYYVGSEPQQPALAQLRIDSTPQQAAAYVDGKFAGYTPTSFAALPGRHDVRVTKVGYQAYQTSVDLRPGQTQSMLVRLQAIRRSGSVTFDSRPPGANVYLDGAYLGSTPLGGVSVNAGSHTARFTLPGYQDARVSFRLAGGENRLVSVSLRAVTGSLLLQANVGGALVFIDGSQVGTVPSGSGRLPVPGLRPGPHQLTLVAPGYRSYVASFNIQGGETTAVSAAQAPL